MVEEMGVGGSIDVVEVDIAENVNIIERLMKRDWKHKEECMENLSSTRREMKKVGFVLLIGDGNRICRAGRKKNDTRLKVAF